MHFFNACFFFSPTTTIRVLFLTLERTGLCIDGWRIRIDVDEWDVEGRIMAVFQPIKRGIRRDNSDTSQATHSSETVGLDEWIPFFWLVTVNPQKRVTWNPIPESVHTSKDVTLFLAASHTAPVLRLGRNRRTDTSLSFFLESSVWRSSSGQITNKIHEETASGRSTCPIHSVHSENNVQHIKTLGAKVHYVHRLFLAVLQWVTSTSFSASFFFLTEQVEWRASARNSARYLPPSVGSAGVQHATIRLSLSDYQRNNRQAMQRQTRSRFSLFPHFLPAPPPLTSPVPLAANGPSRSLRSVVGFAWKLKQQTISLAISALCWHWG